MGQSLWQDRSTGRWVVVTSEMTFGTYYEAEALEQARDAAVQLGCTILILDTQDGTTMHVYPDGTHERSASARVRARNAARRAGASRA